MVKNNSAARLFLNLNCCKLRNGKRETLRVQVWVWKTFTIFIILFITKFYG